MVRDWRMVVIGDDIAAGNGDFAWDEEMQRSSFPMLIAKQASVDFSQLLIEMPGIETARTQDSLTSIPAPQQTTFMRGPRLPNNLSIPGYRIEDSETRRPKSPLFDRDDPRQTLTNLILGDEEHSATDRGLTQVEAAIAERPSLAIVELGYADALEALETRNIEHIGDTVKLGQSFTHIVQSLKGTGASIILCTIPDPSDTGYLASQETVAALSRSEPELLRNRYNLNPEQFVSLPGIFQIGFSLISRESKGKINPSFVFSHAELLALSSAIQAANREIALVARQNGATLYDLANLFRRVKAGEFSGIGITGDPLGGFFGLDGRFPSRTGQAIIANDLIAVLNGSTADPLPQIDVEGIAARDPSANIERAGKSVFSVDNLRPLTPADGPPLPGLDTSGVIGFVPATQVLGCRPPLGVPPCGLPDPGLKKPLRLPTSREEILTLNPESSYYGDAVKMVDCPTESPSPGFQNFPTFGTCANPLFGGIALGDSHLHGKVRIRFSEPKDGIAHFEITHPEGLSGDDGELASPRLFRLPLRLNSLRDVPGLISSGDLELATGRVVNLQYFTAIFNTALWALISVNPNLPPRPIGFPGPAGSASAVFENRPDGLLDITFNAHTFLPLGKDLGGREVRLPLPLCSPDFKCASVLARGASLHPHISFSTKQVAISSCKARCPIIPENATREFTVQSAETFFGDRFQFNSASFGGPATGSAHLVGRIRAQFGPRAGTTIPISLELLPPAGMMLPRPAILEHMPPGTSPGLIGFNSDLNFPALSYPLRHLGLSSDPMDLSIGAVDLRSGEIVGDLLHRGLILQDLILQLMTIEPCTPRSSFCFRGHSRLQQGLSGLDLAFDGTVMVPYPEGYKFPGPGEHPPLVAGPGARLDPFFHLIAFETPSEAHGSHKFAGYAQDLPDLHGVFSIRYSIPCGEGHNGSFTYTDSTRAATFELSALTWVNCAESDLGGDHGETVTFTGIGRWKTDSQGGAPNHQASVQIFRSSRGTHAAVLIDAGESANSFRREEPVTSSHSDLQRNWPTPPPVQSRR